MSNVDRVGVFRGQITDRGIAATKNGFPQLVLQLRATEKYNEAEEVWEDWSQYEEVEATAYIVLFGGNGKPTFGVEQAKRALGWNGASFLSLQEDTSVERIQWRMAENTYEGKTSLQVAAIDAYDAEPGRKVRKLDVADVKKLDARYAAQLKALGGGPKPKSAKPKSPPKEGPPADPTQTMSSAEKPSSPPSGTPSGGSKPPKPPAPKAMTQAEAWAAAYEQGQAKDKTDKDINEAWLAAVSEKGGDDVVGDDWSGVLADVLARLG